MTATTEGLAGVGMRYPELGRIRAGHKATKQNRDGKTVSYPAKLSTWRLTGRRRDYLEQAALLYGGEVTEWDGAPGDGTAYQLFTTSSALDVVIVPGGRSIMQAWERWQGAECVRRCDGDVDGRTGEACDCPGDLGRRAVQAADGDACQPVTRLSVLLPRIRGFGVWRLDTHGLNGAAELAGTAALLQMLGATGQVATASLVLDQRSSKRNGQVRNYAVPMLVPNIAAAELPALAGTYGTAAEVEAPDDVAPQLEAARPELTSTTQTSAAEPSTVQPVSESGAGHPGPADTPADGAASGGMAASPAGQPSELTGAYELPPWLAEALERSGESPEWARGVLVEAGFGVLDHDGPRWDFTQIAGGDQDKALQALRDAWAARKAGAK